MSYRNTGRTPYRTVLGYVYPDGNVLLKPFYTASKKEGRLLIHLAKEHGWSRVYDGPRTTAHNAEVDMDTWEEVTNVDHEPAELDSPFWVPEDYTPAPASEHQKEIEGREDQQSSDDSPESDGRYSAEKEEHPLLEGFRPISLGLSPADVVWVPLLAGLVLGGILATVLFALLQVDVGGNRAFLLVWALVALLVGLAVAMVGLVRALLSLSRQQSDENLQLRKEVARLDADHDLLSLRIRMSSGGRLLTHERIAELERSVRGLKRDFDAGRR